MLIILCIKDIKMLLFEFGIKFMNKYIWKNVVCVYLCIYIFIFVWIKLFNKWW